MLVKSNHCLLDFRKFEDPDYSTMRRFFWSAHRERSFEHFEQAASLVVEGTARLYGWRFFQPAARMVVRGAARLLSFGTSYPTDPFKPTEFGAYHTYSDGYCGAEPVSCLWQMKAGRKPPIAPDAFGERMRAVSYTHLTLPTKA